jgi:hypothetical protein
LTLVRVALLGKRHRRCSSPGSRSGSGSIAAIQLTISLTQRAEFPQDVVGSARRARAIPVVALINLLFGIGFAVIARDRIKADGPFASPAFPLVALHAAAVVAPIALYFYAVHPAWAWMYWVDPSKLATIFVLPLMVGHAALVIGGWYISSFLIRKGYGGALLYAAGCARAVPARARRRSASAGCRRRPDYPGYDAGAGVSLFAVKLGWAFVVSLIAMFGSAIYVAIELGRDGRRVRAR